MARQKLKLVKRQVFWLLVILGVFDKGCLSKLTEHHHSFLVKNYFSYKLEYRVKPDNNSACTTNMATVVLCVEITVSKSILNMQLC